MIASCHSQAQREWHFQKGQMQPGTSRGMSQHVLYRLNEIHPKNEVIGQCRVAARAGQSQEGGGSCTNRGNGMWQQTQEQRGMELSLDGSYGYIWFGCFSPWKHQSSNEGRCREYFIFYFKQSSGIYQASTEAHFWLVSPHSPAALQVWGWWITQSIWRTM